jgi:hypothetical protein
MVSTDHIVQQEKIGNHVPMNYENYELKIVEEHGLELIGWPQGRVRNPGKVGGRTSVTRLLAALRDKSCRWVKLDPAALDARIARNHTLAARGESVYKPRKKATHTNTPGPSKSKFKSQEIIDSDDNDTESAAGDDSAA